VHRQLADAWGFFCLGFVGVITLADWQSGAVVSFFAGLIIVTPEAPVPPCWAGHFCQSRQK
jgi:hypothetical protein